MRVSIITPTYNRATFLPETIDSILDQNYPDLEYIVLDDGSTDDTQTVLARYSGRIRVVRHDNMGETATVNKGFSLVSGDIVCVVCSDDPLLPGAIQHVVEAFQKNPEAVAVYPDWVDIDQNGEFLRAVRLPSYDISNMLLSLSWGLGPGAFFRRSLIGRIGGRNPNRAYCGDMEFWAIAAMLGPLVHVPKLLATHRTHQGSASVAQLGKRFAKEWVDTWESLLKRPELPADVLAAAPELLSKVCLSASRNYCGADKAKAKQLFAHGVYILPLINGLRRFAKLRFARRSLHGVAIRSAMNPFAETVLDISIEHVSTGSLTTGQTDGIGRFCVDNLPEGAYTVRFGNGEVQHHVHGGGSLSVQTAATSSNAVRRSLYRLSGRIANSPYAFVRFVRRLVGPILRFVYRSIKGFVVRVLNILFLVKKPGIEVSIEPSPKGRVRKTRTDGDGRLCIERLPQGRYTVKFANGEIQTCEHPGGSFTAQTAVPPVTTSAQHPAGFTANARRLAVALLRKFIVLAVGIVRWRNGLRPSAAPVIPGFSHRFAICTRFTPPLWSGQAVVLGRLVEGLPPVSYCMISLPLYPETKDGVDFTPPLPGKRYLLPPERALPRLSVPARWQEAWRQIGLLYQAWQRGVNIARVLQDDPADTIVGCSGDLLDLPAAIIAGRILERRVVIYFFDDYTEQWWAEPALRMFASRVERRVVARAAKILVTNEYMQSEIMRRYGRTSTIIRNPSPSGISSDIQEQFPMEPGEVKLVFTGAVYHLNFDILRAILRALELIEADISSGVFVGVRHRLHIYTAQAREQLENEGLVGPHVVIHSHVKPDEAAEIQRNADILIIPFSFRPEAKGIIRTAATAKLADYLAAGRPILALCPEDSFLAWYLNDRECGWVVSSEQPQQIAATIYKITNQWASRKRMQRNALDAALKEFTPAVASARLAKALDLVALPSYMYSSIPASHPGQLKVVQVSGTDLVGMQVNGFLVHKWLQKQEHGSRLLVNSKMSGDRSVREIGSPLKRMLNPLFVRVEAKLDSTAMLPVLSHRLDKDPWVREADVVNLHLIHAAPFFSLLDLPRLSRKKKVILSVHDMFFLTGHCIYSMDCERWKTGCGECPDLGLPFPMSQDTTARNWKLKRWIFDRSELDIVVGSPWQDERVSQSPLLSRFRRHMIPYGIDTRVFKEGDKRDARRRLGVPEDAHVIAFRSCPFHRNFKGTTHIQQALQMFQPSRPTVLLTFEGVGGLDDLRDKYQFHELGWVVDGEKIALGLQAADIFLMPSTAEAFGLMAIESMACGTPPIVFDGTALPVTIGGPDCGVIVPQGDAAALAKAIADCMDDPERMDVYRRNGMRHVSSKHSFEDYARRYLDLYQKLAKEKRK